MTVVCGVCDCCERFVRAQSVDYMIDVAIKRLKCISLFNILFIGSLDGVFSIYTDDKLILY